MIKTALAFHKARQAARQCPYTTCTASQVQLRARTKASTTKSDTSSLHLPLSLSLVSSSVHSTPELRSAPVPPFTAASGKGRRGGETDKAGQWQSVRSKGTPFLISTLSNHHLVICANNDWDSEASARRHVPCVWW
jgi:hypothetical protein